MCELAEAIAALLKIAESLARIEQQLRELDSTLVGSFDELSATLGDLAQSMDRFLGRIAK